MTSPANLPIRGRQLLLLLLLLLDWYCHFCRAFLARRLELHDALTRRCADWIHYIPSGQE